MMQLLRRFSCVLLLASVFATSAHANELTVSAASSLQNALNELGAAYTAETKVKVTFNFGSSGALQQQIENGAPVDLFIAAAAKQMDALEAKSLIVPGSRQTLLKNTLVLVVPAGRSGIASFDDLKQAGVKKIAVGDPKTVPAGQYAQETFASLKLSEALAPKLVPAGNVRQVLTYVETKEVDAGVVYASDAHDSTKVTVVGTAPATAHSPIVYPVAVLKRSKNAAAAAKLSDWLSSKAARDVFVKHGFIVGQTAI